MPHITIYESELELLRTLTADSPRIEIGGELIGLWSHGDAPTVMLATGPAPTATRTPTHFVQDAAVHREIERLAWHRYGLQVLGIWHSHHSLGLHELSGGDRKRTQTYSRNSGRRRYTEILTFLAQDSQHTVCLRPHIYSDAVALYEVPSDFRVLNGVSPVRADLAKLEFVAPMAAALLAWDSGASRKAERKLSGGAVTLLTNHARAEHSRRDRHDTAPAPSTETGPDRADLEPVVSATDAVGDNDNADARETDGVSAQELVMLALLNAVNKSDPHVQDSVTVDSSDGSVRVTWAIGSRDLEMVIPINEPRVVRFRELGHHPARLRLKGGSDADLASFYLKCLKGQPVGRRTLPW